MHRTNLFRTLAAMACTLALAATAHADDDPASPFTAYGNPGVWLTRHDDGTTRQVLADVAPDAARWPASSIKPLLALVALESGALESSEEVIPWDGTPYPNFPQWQRPMALAEAMRSSSESYFRTLAQRIGRDTLADWVARVEYGNGVIGEQADRAWHDGVLLITPLQQLDFIDRLRRGDLPFAPGHMAAVRESMRDRSVDGTAVFGKTGTHLGDGGHNGAGWFVGWTQGGPNDASFVLMVALDGFDGRDRRIRLAHELLRDSGPAAAATR